MLDSETRGQATVRTAAAARGGVGIRVLEGDATDAEFRRDVARELGELARQLGALVHALNPDHGLDGLAISLDGLITEAGAAARRLEA